MKRVTLHIGRQKTGTTAIQRFLYENPALLQEHNMHYPQFGLRSFGHHDLGGPIARMNLADSPRRVEDIVEELRAGLADEIQNINSSIVISSESFQNCEPRIVRQLFCGYKLDIVVYLREQVGFMASAYAQKVQATDYSKSFEDFCSASLYSNYQKFLDAWNNEFPSRVQVRNYDRNELVGADIVMDFCQSILEIPSKNISRIQTASDPNPTLTRDLLEFKIRVNRHCPLTPAQAKLLFNGLAHLAQTDESGKISVPPSLIQKVTKHYEESNRVVAKKYFGRKQLFAEYRPPASLDSDENIDVRIENVRARMVKLHPTLAAPLSRLQP